MRNIRPIGLCFLALAISSPSLSAADKISSEARNFFESKIRPALIKHCYQCHSADAEELGGKLRLDSRAGMLTGGESGPVLIPGKPAESLLIHSLRYQDLEMPPEGPLPENVIHDFEQWIALGAADPRVDVPAAQKANPTAPSAIDREALWSFLPRRSPRVPDVRQRDWPRDPIDQFVLAKIEAASLAPAKDADPRTLLRRLYFDLMGLPPTMEQVFAFEHEYQLDSENALRRVVDQLLDQPQFGERWGRHWLDVARYGEANGNDGLGRNATFPHAWRFRDYVIDAFNRDIPYDQFLREQIAGDLLPAETAEQRNRQLVATGFLAIGSKPAAAMNNNFAMDIVDDQINAVCSGIIGLSVACARCHDHKHDPIPTKDYYALAGIFASTETLYGLAANEKLTAPPTPLHELTTKWPPESANEQQNESAKAGAAPQFPDKFEQTITELNPAIYAPLSEVSSDLRTPVDQTFTPDQYANVKASTLTGQFTGPAESYSVGFWFKNETDNLARPITAYLFSRAPLGNKELPGDHLGIGGAFEKSRSGKLFVFNGNNAKKSVVGTTVIAPQTWNHVLLIRDKKQIRVYLNGQLEIDAGLAATFGDNREFCLANRSDHFAPLVGNLGQFVMFERGLQEKEALRLYDAFGQPRAEKTPPIGLAMGVRDKAKPTNIKIHINGETSKLGPEVPRGVLTAYRSIQNVETASDKETEFSISPNQSGRLELAQWLTRPDHPQTTRVLVNRLWMHLFGQGIVQTPNDFGIYGSRPTHPELLDHLADRFVREHWSIKRMIRALVLTRAYRLDSQAEPQVLRADPDNLLWARQSRRRMDAESLRDSMMHVAGTLDLSPGIGSAVEDKDTLLNWPAGESTNLHRPSPHRSIYLCMLRHSPPAELAAFDLPEGVDLIGQRSITTLPTQALFLLNSQFMVDQSQSLAGQQLSRGLTEQRSLTQALFQQVLQRDPLEFELERSLAFLAAMEATLSTNYTEPESRQQKVWASLVQALLMTNEFRYID